MDLRFSLDLFPDRSAIAAQNPSNYLAKLHALLDGAAIAARSCTAQFKLSVLDERNEKEETRSKRLTLVFPLAAMSKPRLDPLLQALAGYTNVGY